MPGKGSSKRESSPNNSSTKKSPTSPTLAALAPPKQQDGEKQQQQQRSASNSSRTGVVRLEHGHVTEADFVDFEPHTLFGGVLLLGSLYMTYRHYYHVPDTPSGGNMLTEGEVVYNNAKLGIGAALGSLVAFGMLHFPDGIMVRPHPMIWRGLMACLVMYMMIVIFFLFQDYKTTRKIIGWYEPASLIDEEDRNWAEDCRISTPERPWLLLETIFDEFLLAHLLGYIGKMLVLRDWHMVMFISFGFEIIEFSLQYMLPNFAECWYDHIFADLVVCNAGGALIGWLVLKLVGAKEYDFVALRDIRSVKGKVKRVASQLRPRSLDRFQWEMFDSFKRFMQIMGLLLVMLFGEINSFVTKLLWNLPATHHLVLFRLVIFGFGSISGVREYYEWVSGAQKEATRIGIMAWLIIFNFVLETAWCLKMIHESDHVYFKAKMPAHVGVPWVAALALFAFWIVAFFSTRSFRLKKTFGAWLWRGIISAVLYLVVLIIFLMCVMATPHVEWGRKPFEDWVQRMGLW